MSFVIATPRQVSYLKDLLASRSHDLDEMDFDKLTKEVASSLIDYLYKQPRKAVVSTRPARVISVSKVGMYQLPTGEIYRVHEGRNTGRLYAKQLDPIAGGFSYSAGAIYLLTPENKMSLEDAMAIGVATGVCCVCGAFLTDTKSVERGIGPVCRKQFD